MSCGLVHLYTGDGKGKTTAALGLSLRALGAGYEVFFFQFMKMGDSSEFRIFKDLDNVTTAFFGLGKFVNRGQKDEAYQAEAKSNLQGVESVFSVFKGAKKNPETSYLIVLDEICLLLFFEIITVNDVIGIIWSKPDNVELVLTGRRAPEEILKYCDYVSEIREVKHPYQKGIQARDGIES